MHRIPSTLIATLALSSAAVLVPRAAEACGCFAPPDPTVPVVQAGERIVFAHADGKVIAHIQIQYQGEATEFGWLLPLPSVPELTLGTEELFTQVLQTTQPRYRLNRVGNDQCLFPVFGPVPSRGASDSANLGGESEGDTPLVIEDSIGPYDYAVLEADSRDEMFDWLTDNRYFIPTGTEDVVGPYIRPGAYFLALKLRKGNDAGDIQPVVLKYPSDLPMIPIILTSVAATPDMGVQVWVLGDSRAIPRNYRHTVLNEEHIDWFDAGANYPDVVIRATNEAPEGQSFVTEYAGSTDRMVGTLDWEGRFGERDALEGIQDPFVLAQAVTSRGFPNSSTFRNTLARYYPLPEALAAQGVSPEDFYPSLGYFLGRYRDRNPELFEGYAPEVDPSALVADLWERIVTPTLEAGALFRENPIMTRMITTLSPEEMTRDPVFSFNPDLPMVSNEHEATFELICGEDQNGPNDTPGVLILEDGRRFYVADQAAWADEPLSAAPYSRRIEILREEGPPIVDIDNEALLTNAIGSSGCTCATPLDSERSSWWALATLLGAVGLVFRRRGSKPRA